MNQNYDFGTIINSPPLISERLRIFLELISSACIRQPSLFLLYAKIAMIVD